MRRLRALLFTARGDPSYAQGKSPRSFLTLQSPQHRGWDCPLHRSGHLHCSKSKRQVQAKAPEFPPLCRAKQLPLPPHLLGSRTEASPNAKAGLVTPVPASTPAFLPGAPGVWGRRGVASEGKRWGPCQSHQGSNSSVSQMLAFRSCDSPTDILEMDFVWLLHTLWLPKPKDTQVP